MNCNLVVARVSIQEAEVTLSCQMVHNLVDERLGKVILLPRRIQLSIIETDLPFCQKGCLDLLSLLFHGDRDSKFLGNNMY